MWEAWADSVYMEEPVRFAQFARKIWGICEEDDQKAARATGNDTFTVAKFKELHKQDIFEILKKANHS